MSAAEQLEMARVLAPFVVLVLIAGLVGGVSLIARSKKRSSLYVGVALMAFSAAAIAGLLPGLAILYLP